MRHWRRKLAAGWLLIACGCVSASARAADAGATTEIARGGTPAWAVAHDIPTPSQTDLAQSSDGIIWLLLDTQIHAENGDAVSYERSTKRVKDRSGLEEAGAVRVEFDPRDETVTLNYVHVIRDGKVIDHTKDLSLEIIRRESDLDDGVTDGRVTAVGNIADVRVGDTIDFATTIRSNSALWRGHLFRQVSARWSTPLPLRVMRITWPSERPILFKTINSDAAFTRKVVGPEVVYELVQRDAPPQAPEKGVPSWKPAYGVISLSTMSSWREVADWAVPLYQGDESLDGEFAAEVDRIAAHWSRPEDRLTEAARLVQDRIRYVGVEIGEGSFIPRRPAEVVRKGYGDCKDKSLLLAVVLRRLGIEATPALVATGWGPGLPDWAPSPIDFDHVIVRAELDGKPVWIDPTLHHQGGRGAAMVTPDYGYVLPIRAGQHELERIVRPAPTRDQQQVVEHFEVDATSDPAVRLRAETIYRDGRANWMRASLATQPVSELAKRYLDYYAGYYPGIVEARPLAVEDDRDANVVRTVETYTVPRAAFDKAKLLGSFPVRADAIMGLLPDKQNAPRRNALFLPPDLRRTHVIEVSQKDHHLAVPADLDEKAAGVELKRTSRLEGDAAIMTFALTTSGEAFAPPDAAAGVYALADKLDDEGYLEFHLDKTGQSLGAALGVPADEIAPFKARIRQVANALDKLDPPSILQALTLLNAMSSEVKRPSATAGLIDGYKGLVLIDAKRYAAAEAALESSASQYQGNVQMLQLLAALQLQAGKPVETVKTLGIVARNHPDQIAALTDDFVRSVRMTLRKDRSPAGEAAADDLALLLVESGWQQSPMTSYGQAIRTDAIKRQLERGRTAEARHLFALGPIPSETAAALAVDNRYAALWPDLDGAVHDHFRSLVAQDVARSTAALAKSPDDLRLMTVNVSDLRRAGQAEKALTVAKAAVADRGRIEAAGVDGFWLANEYANALVDAGRRDEAMALMDWLVVGLGSERYPELVSQAINRAEMLNAGGRPAEALAAFTAIADTSASPYGRMWIWSGTVCAAQALGKADVVKQSMAKVEAAQDENPAAMTQALACLANMDRLEATLIKRLDDPRERDAALSGFSTLGERPRTDFERRLATVLDTARKSPAVAAKFKSYGRAVTFDGRPGAWDSY